MGRQRETAAASYDVKRVDKVAIIIIWAMIAMIIEQVLVKGTEGALRITLQSLVLGAVVTAIAFVKIPRFVKSLLICLLPSLGVVVTMILNAFTLNMHYMLCMGAILIALYFESKLLLVFGGILDALLLAVYLIAPEHMLGAESGFLYFLSVYLMYNFVLLGLFFLTKWGREIINNVERNKDELQAALDDLKVSSDVQKKQAAYMNEGVRELLKSMDSLSQGELDLRVELKVPDDDARAAYELLDAIVEKLHEAVKSIRGYIAETAAALAKVSRGNLSTKIEAEFKGDFAQLKTSINSIVGSLNAILADIHIAAEQVAAGTRQVSDGSQNISQGATEQASSIAALTDSVKEIASQTRDNAIKADRASELSISAKESAVRGSARMESLQTAMKGIDEASADISKIIKVIDEIAFQTNILALNAAVEAARAGAHGKGFGVVAEEVRNLAGKSAQAASETAALIEGSVKKTEAGAKLADETAKELKGIVDAVENAAGLVGDIAKASNDQATAILQVNHSIEQMSGVVQSNSATAEEAAAASEELSAQAQMLREKVGHFTLA
ncbi:MAG: methyl-accepting chemotaxis protein [Clostridiaceae bacterium]|nr:methyl-accepting chemotaxis protein [Eubacteriales bacterium]